VVTLKTSAWTSGPREDQQVKIAIGTVLRSVGTLITILTLFVATVYVVGCIVWLHAPVSAVLQTTASMVALPLGVAWLCILASGRASTKRWLIGAVGITVLVAAAAIGRTGLNMVECGYGANRVTKAADTRRNGFERVCIGDLARYDIAFKSTASATRALAFTPVDLTHTPFERLESLGARVESIGGVRSRLYRGFRLPDGHLLTLSEHDMSADGSRTWRDPKDEPERINGLPVRLGIFEDTPGKAVSHLSWVEGRRSYELWIDANVVREPLRDRLFVLAASLPRSVPACPNEPPPKPLHFAADGQPVAEPMPKVLTRVEMDAMVDRSNRPCK
jgi:hypothetical protein